MNKRVHERTRAGVSMLKGWKLLGRGVVVALWAVGLGGCALFPGLREHMRQDPVYNGGPVIPDNTFMLKGGETALPSACETDFDGKKIDEWTDAQNAGIKLCTRAMLLLIDIRWSRFADELNSAVSTGSTLADIATLGLNISGQLTAPGTTKVLSAIAAGITGSKSIINEDVLYKNSVQTIQLQMIKDRSIIKKRILERLDGGHPYGSMFEAALDLYEYDRAGSWNQALLSLQSDIATHSAECRTQLANTQQAIAENTDNAKTTTPPATANVPCGASETSPGSPTVLSRIFFDKNKFAIEANNTEAADALKAIKAKCAAKTCTSITIIGKASFDTNVAGNRQISQQRADAVKDALIAEFNSAPALALPSITAQGVGNSQPVPGLADVNRVVEISVTQ